MAASLFAANTMSEGASDNKISCCAGCGVKEDDDIKLKTCNACYLVRYCGSKCQRDHWPQHKKECKKRAAELRDEILFKQPESSNLGDCPICCLPLPLAPIKSTLMSCCCKLICNGCDRENVIQELREKRPHKCPFCRHPSAKTTEESNLMLKKRCEANDPAAISQMGIKLKHYGNYNEAFEYLTKAAKMGDAAAHYELAESYRLGEGVERNTKKQFYHLEEAVIGGHPHARLHLAIIEQGKLKLERAVKHLIIATNLGHDPALEKLKTIYAGGLVSKQDFEATLRAHKAALDATKSAQRVAAEDILP